MNEADLYDYQRTAKDHLLEHTHGALFMEMGLGKTVSTLTALKALLYDELDIRNALIVAPKRVAESVWSAEIEKWDHLSDLSLIKIIGTEKQRKQALATKGDLYIISRDNVAWLCGLYGGLNLPFDALVIDELSSFKNAKSQRFKALRRVQPSLKRVIGLTGTPAPNGLIDLWSQIYLLDRGERLGKFITQYRDKYFNPAKRRGDTIFSYALKKEAEQVIHNRISDICISMKAEDYINLPGRIDNIIRLNFSERLKAQYEDFERDAVISLFSETDYEREISAVNAAALQNKLLQFANGAVYDEDHNSHYVHEIKLDAAKEIIEDANGKPVLLAWTYRQDQHRLLKHLKKFSPRILKNNQDIEDWNNGKIKVLMMHPASGGHGLNLQAGGHIVLWFGQTWSTELEQQLNARLFRQGQKDVVVINKLVMSGTWDEQVIDAQNRKATTQDDLMKAVRAKIKKYLK